LAYTPNWKDDNTDLLVKALLSLTNEDETYRLLDDLCTISEIKAMAQRLQVAYQLSQDITYNTIVNNTGASTATISRVKRYLNYGAGGYKKVLKNLDGEKNYEN